MSVKKLSLTGPGIIMDAQGTVDLVNRHLSMMPDLQTLGTLHKVLGLVPVLGKAAERLIHAYRDINGPLEDAKIDVHPDKGISEAIKEETRTIRREP